MNLIKEFAKICRLQYSLGETVDPGTDMGPKNYWTRIVRTNEQKVFKLSTRGKYGFVEIRLFATGSGYWQSRSIVVRFNLKIGYRHVYIGQYHEIFYFRFFFMNQFPPRLSIQVGPSWIFLKICGSRCTTGVTTPNTGSKCKKSLIKKFINILFEHLCLV